MTHQDDVPVPLVPPTPPAPARAAVSLSSPDDHPFGLGFTRRELQTAADFFHLARIVRGNAVWVIISWLLPAIIAFSRALTAPQGWLLMILLSVWVAASLTLLLIPRPVVTLVSGLALLLDCVALLLVNLLLPHLGGIEVFIGPIVLTLALGVTGCILFYRFSHLIGLHPDPAALRLVRRLAEGRLPDLEMDAACGRIDFTTLDKTTVKWYAMLSGDDLLLITESGEMRILHWSDLIITTRGSERKGQQPVTIHLQGRAMPGDIRSDYLAWLHAWQASRAVQPQPEAAP
jgi:hypothetical protein